MFDNASVTELLCYLNFCHGWKEIDPSLEPCVESAWVDLDGDTRWQTDGLQGPCAAVKALERPYVDLGAPAREFGLSPRPKGFPRGAVLDARDKNQIVYSGLCAW